MAADDEIVATERASVEAQLLLLQNTKPAAPPAPADSRRNFGTLAGNGDESYSKNSSSQGKAVQIVLPLLVESIHRVPLPITSPTGNGAGPLLIADLGCASGPNSLKNVDAIVSTLKETYSNRGLQVPSFQVFFQDLPSNDFNNLFRLVSEENGFYHSEENGKSPSTVPKYFAAGVPGSFYDRLFPDASMHVIFSSYCLHWMSKVPKQVMVKGNPAFNKDKSWVHGATPEVAAAYKEAAARDLRAFLSARAAEVVPGGLAFLLFLGRRNPDPLRVLDDEGGLPAILWDLVDMVLAQLAAEGIISEEMKDSYNSATYLRSVEEVQETVESCSSDWRVLKLEPLPIYHFAEYLARYNTKPGESPHSFARRVLLMFKVTRAPQIIAHIGPELSKVFWEKYENMFFSQTGLVENFYSRIQSPGNAATQILVSLIRK